MYKLCVHRENEINANNRRPFVDSLISDYYAAGGTNPGWEDLRSHCRKNGFTFCVEHEVNAYPDDKDPAMQYHVRQTNFVFKSEAAATLFLLRWS